MRHFVRTIDHPSHIVMESYGGMGNGISAWKALKERFDGNTKQARRVAREELFRSTMDEHVDPEDFFAKTDRLRHRLEEKGQDISDEVYESSLLYALPEKFAFIRHRHYEDDSLDIDSLKKTAITYNIDMNVTPNISGCGMAMGVSDAGTGSCCKACGHCKTDGNQTNKKEWKKGKTGSGGGQPKWCSYHNTTTHGDNECQKQNELKGWAANLALLQSAGHRNVSNVGSAHVAQSHGPQASINFGSAHLAQHQGPEPSTFGFSFNAIRETLPETSANATPSMAQKDSHLPDGLFGAS